MVFTDISHLSDLNGLVEVSDELMVCCFTDLSLFNSLSPSDPSVIRRLTALGQPFSSRRLIQKTWKFRWKKGRD